MRGALAERRIRLRLRLTLTLAADASPGSAAAGSLTGVRGVTCRSNSRSAWSPDAPNLYDLAIELLRDGAVCDEVGRTVGFRRFEAKDGRLFLNGEPFFMFGALDQDWHRGRELARRTLPASRAALSQRQGDGPQHAALPRQDSRPHYFELADRLGLIVWLDMPYMGFLAPATREAVARVFPAIRRRPRHPSLDLHLDAVQRGLGHRTRRQSGRPALADRDCSTRPSRSFPKALLVDNSPCFPRNYHVKTDIEDFHWYNGFPHQNEAFAATTRAFAARAAFPWSPHGDAVKRGDEPLICSEFGVWGLPHPREFSKRTAASPGGSRAATTGTSARPIRMGSRRAFATPHSRRSSATSTASSTRRRSSSIARLSTRSRRCAGSGRSPAM